jgi:sacsin
MERDLCTDLAPFKDLLLKLGATLYFSERQYASVLEDMYRKQQGMRQHSDGAAAAAAAAANGPLLSQQEVSQSIAVVQAIAALRTKADASQHQGPPPSSTHRDHLSHPHPHPSQTLKIYIADENGLLRPLSELAFNDAPWLGVGNGPPRLPGVHLVHPLVPNVVAERVGVPSLRRLLIVRSSDTMSLGLASMSSSAAEAFGQSEALTTRLR